MNFAKNQTPAHLTVVDETETFRAATHLGDVEFTDRGEGPVLVFLHLVFGAGDHWDRLIAQLVDRYRCIAPTLPMGAHRVAAHPDADLTPTGLARAVAELLDSLDISDVTLVGNDTGGALAQIAAVDFGERVGSLVLTNCDLYHEFPPKQFARLLKPLAATPGGLTLASRFLRFRPLWKLPFVFGALAHELDAEKLDRWRKRMFEKDVRRDLAKVIAGMDPTYTQRAAEGLKQLDLPILLAWGEDDTAFDRSNAERMHQEIPTAQLQLIPGARAAVCWDQPNVLAELIEKHEQRRNGPQLQ